MAFGVILFLVGVFAVSSAGVLLVIDHQIAAATNDGGAFFWAELALLVGGAVTLLAGALWLAYTARAPLTPRG
jgi:hypothetical protein